MITTYCFEKDIEKIENYELAKKDNFVGWVIHHRLETHFSNGDKRPVNCHLTSAELRALQFYDFVSPDVLIFMKDSEHRTLHNKSRSSAGHLVTDAMKQKMSERLKGRKAWNKGLKMTDGYKETCRKRTIGKKWWTNGIEDRQSFECPGEGFVLGRKTKGRPAWNKGKKTGVIPWNKGLKKELEDE